LLWVAEATPAPEEIERVYFRIPSGSLYNRPPPVR